MSPRRLISNHHSERKTAESSPKPFGPTHSPGPGLGSRLAQTGVLSIVWAQFQADLPRNPSSHEESGLDCLEKRLDRLERHFDRLWRRLDGLERHLGRLRKYFDRLTRARRLDETSAVEGRSPALIGCRFSNDGADWEERRGGEENHQSQRGGRDGVSSPRHPPSCPSPSWPSPSWPEPELR